ncbi:CAP-Gly domain-containing linker protein 1-like isoform X4 [Biomphalaria glabrata]|uniref:CAP-Gly domain-containing linker protein 1-like isoform X4 n=1 Tax=Biomphalaria glabrata TaxID=6526 RepID=A0A9W3BL80_BIOGL|nr:CAP-Gly domain-containing linker protein 1-like isoform X4 [Biomphalaria glabrata]
MPFNIDEDVEIGPTPGHTGNDVSVVVKKANLGVLAVVGDLFYCEGDLFSPSLWLKKSERPHLQVQSRYTILEMADFIIPGHGPTFKVELEEQKRTKENFRKRMREVKELDITADNLVKSLESSLKEKEHEVKQEQQRNRELDAKFKNLLQEKESIEAQLQKILDNHYTEKSELSSKIKSLQEEKKKLKDVKEQNKQCEHLSDSDSTEIDLDSSIFLQEDVGLQPIDHEQPSSHSVSEENLRNTSNEVSNLKSRLIDVEHEKIMLVKQLTQFRSKYNYITRQKDKEIQRLKSELELVQITTCGLFFALSLHDTFHVRTKNPLLALNFNKLNRASHLNLIYSSYIVLWYSMYSNV